MQDAPAGWPTDDAELTPTATLTHTVNGVEETAQPESWSVRRELSGDLPDQIQSAEGLSVASAQIELAQTDAETVRNAWSPWEDRTVIRQPAGASVELTAGFGGVEIPMFVGRVAEPSGDIRSPGLELECDDLASLLRDPATLPAVAREMPHDIGDGVSIRYTGLTATWAVDAILRQGGFCATPAAADGAVLLATLQGSMWPEIGRLTRANQGSTTQPRFAGIRWNGRRMLGWQAPAAATFNWKIEPAADIAASTMHVSGWTDGSTGTATVDLRTGDSADSRVTITITATQITVRFRADSGAIDASEVYTFVGGPWDVDLERLTATSVRVTMTDRAGAQTDDVTTGSFGGNLDNMEASLASGDLVLAGLQVSPQQSGTVAVSHVPSADLDPSLNSIDGTPGLEGDVTQWAALREIATAELAVIFLAEDGRATFRNRDSLRGLNLAPGGLLLPGQSGMYASTPDAAALDITGDLDVRAYVSLPDWRTGTTQTLLAKYNTTGNQRAYQFHVNSGGALVLQWSTNGTDAPSASSTANPVPGSANGTLAVRATLDANNGAAGRTITFYTGPTLAGPWTQLGSPVVQAGTTSVNNSTAALQIGGRDLGTANLLIGTVHKVEVRSGIGGTVVASADFTALARGTTSFTDSAGLAWTVHGGAQITTTLPLRCTSRDTIVGLQWWSSVEQVRSEVRVPVMPVAVTTSTDYSRTVWTLDDKVKVFEAGRRPIAVFADLTAVPIELDTAWTFSEAGASGSQFSARDNSDGSGDTRGLVITTEQVSPRRVKLTIRTAYASTEPAWIVTGGGTPRMVLRALATIDQPDSAEAHAVAVNEGVEETYGTSVLELPESRWMQDMDAAQALAWWLAAQTAQPQPIIRDVPVVPGPDTLRLQLGDLIELVDPDVMGATVRCVVTGITASGSAGQVALSLRVRPIPYLFADFDTEWAGETFSDLDAELSGVTFGDYDQSPWRFE